MVLGHSAGTAAAVFLQNRTGEPTRAIQDVDQDVLTAALLREGQVLHPPTPPGNPSGTFGWDCEKLGNAGARCIATRTTSAPRRNANCSAECRALAANEWLANTGYWRRGTRSQLVAKQRTFLKKGIVQSNLLPPKLVKEVPAGFRCELVAAGSKTAEGSYDLCSV